jgi:predicted PhzF superfamily epimerase YddE/YHI9
MMLDSAMYQLFSDNPRCANSTVVHLVDAWPDDQQLADIADHGSCHETTFLRRCAGGVELRWFARRIEVPLCGHGALAAAHYLRDAIAEGELVEVCNKAGRVRLSKHDGEAVLVFPQHTITPANTKLPQASFAYTAYDAGRDYLFYTPERDAFRQFDPANSDLPSLDKLGVILATTAPSADLQFRFFAPKAGISEDPASASVIPALVALAGYTEGRRYQFTQGAEGPVRITAIACQGAIRLGGHIFELT